MDAVTLSQVLEQLKRTGKNTDAAGNTTLFARLAQIAAHVDELEARIGSTARRTNVLQTNPTATGGWQTLANISSAGGIRLNKLQFVAQAPASSNGMRPVHLELRIKVDGNIVFWGGYHSDSLYLSSNGILKFFMHRDWYRYTSGLTGSDDPYHYGMWTYFGSDFPLEYGVEDKDLNISAKSTLLIEANINIPSAQAVTGWIEYEN